MTKNLLAQGAHGELMDIGQKKKRVIERGSHKAFAVGRQYKEFRSILSRNFVLHRSYIKKNLWKCLTVFLKTTNTVGSIKEWNQVGVYEIRRLFRFA